MGSHFSGLGKHTRTAAFASLALWVGKTIRSTSGDDGVMAPMVAFKGAPRGKEVDEFHAARPPPAAGVPKVLPASGHITVRIFYAAYVAPIRMATSSLLFVAV